MGTAAQVAATGRRKIHEEVENSYVNVSSLPVRKSCEKRMDQPMTANTRRFTRTTELSDTQVRVDCINYPSVAVAWPKHAHSSTRVRQTMLAFVW